MTESLREKIQFWVAAVLLLVAVLAAFWLMDARITQLNDHYMEHLKKFHRP